MGELINIWREVCAGNRFAETKLTFFVGIMVGILGFLNSGSSLLAGEGRLLAGGDIHVMNIAIIIALVMAISSAFPQLSQSRRWDWLIPSKPPNDHFYLLHIANFSSADAWLTSYRIQLSQEELLRAKELAEQILINAKIAARKFAVLRLASFTLILGWVLSWCVLLYKYYIP